MVLLDYDDRLLTSMGLGPMINHLREYAFAARDQVACWSLCLTHALWLSGV